MGVIRRISWSRSWGVSSEDACEVRWIPNSYVAGVYEVWIDGHCVAQTTDRWMAEEILHKACSGRKSLPRAAGLRRSK